jgi:hypothetical protein
MPEQRRIGFGGNAMAAATSAAVPVRRVEEPVFFDEFPGPAAPVRVADSCAFELFPDEDYGKDPVLRGKNDRSPIVLFEVRKPVTAVADDATAIGRIRPGLLMLFFVAAALATFGTVRACQVNGLTSVTIWQLLGH